MPASGDKATMRSSYAKGRLVTRSCPPGFGILQARAHFAKFRFGSASNPAKTHPMENFLNAHEAFQGASGLCARPMRGAHDYFFVNRTCRMTQ